MNKRQSMLRPADVVAAACLAAFTLLVFTASMARGREYAKRALCSVNMMKLHAAMSHYLADNDGVYCEPDVCFLDRSKVTWDGCPLHDPQIIRIDDGAGGLLWDYIGTGDVLACETFKYWQKVTSSGISPPQLQYDPPFGYSQNVYLGRRHTDGRPLGVGKEAEVISPEEVLVFAEETIWLIPGLAHWVLNDTMFFARHTNDPTSIGDTIATYHKMRRPQIYEGMGNAVFVDGHVELCNPWVQHEYAWGWLTESFYLAWPKGKVFTAEVPY